MGKPPKIRRVKRFNANVAVYDAGTAHYLRLDHTFLVTLLTSSAVPMYMGSRIPAKDRPGSLGELVLLCAKHRRLVSIKARHLQELSAQPHDNKVRASDNDLVDMLDWPTGPCVYGVTYTIELPPDDGSVIVNQLDTVV